MTKVRLVPIRMLGILLVLAATAAAQAPPSTDIYVVKLERGAAGVTLGEPRNVTARAGYDNQPAFTPDGRRILYTSIGEDAQADIRAYDLESKQDRRLTETPESEYSPTPIDGGKAFSVVRVEADQKQRLWRFPMGGGEPELLLPNVEPVGYHAWSDERDLILFVLGEPPTLQKASVGERPGEVLAQNPGRSLHRIPGSDGLSFVHKEDGGWTIKKVDPKTGKIEPLVATRPEREDYAWSASGEVWMGDGGAFYVWKPGRDGWTKVADFSELGIQDITRLAIHPEEKALAFVASGSD